MNRSETGRVVALAQERHVVERRFPGKQRQETQIRVAEQIGRVDIHLVLRVLQRRRRLTVHGWSPAQRPLNHSPIRCAGVLLLGVVVTGAAIGLTVRRPDALGKDPDLTFRIGCRKSTISRRGALEISDLSSSVGRARVQRLDAINIDVGHRGWR